MGQVTLERDHFIWGLGSLPAYAKSACVPVCLYNGRKIARNIHSFTLYLPLSGMYRMRYFARTDIHGHGPSSHHENEEKPRCKDTPPATTIFAPFLIPVTTVSSWTICTDPYPTIARPEVRHFIPFQALPLIDLKFNVRVNKVHSLCVRQESLCHASGGRHFVPGYRTKVRREASGL